ncbi:MAG TPA: glycosyltransferase family 4 protein [Chloroflexia bacterium]|nr:glycosyltransferase family 4 protein [Chloroflexia bacterium]
MRVLHVIQRYWPYQGGSEGYFQELSARLVARGDQVTVFTTDAWDLEHFWAPGKRRVTRPATETYQGVAIHRFPVRRPPLPPIYFRILRRLMAETSDLARRVPGVPTPLWHLGGRLSPWVPRLEAALAALPPGRFDVVHTTNITLEAPIIAALAYARRVGIPALITPFLHLGEPGDRRIIRYYTMRHQLALLKRAARVIVQTGLEGAALRDFGIAANRLVQVSVGVHPDQVLGGEAARFRARYQLAPELPLVLFVGALAHDKGAVTLLEAGRRLWAAGRDLRLVLIGATALADFQAVYAHLPAAEQARVLLLGFVPDAVKRDAYAACTVFAMPSRTDTLGLVYLEAWLYDKPVIGARAGGVPAVIADGQDGYLIRFGDAAALADRIAAVIADPALAHRLGQAGHAKVLAHYTWDRQLPRLLALYDEVVRET